MTDEEWVKEIEKGMVPKEEGLQDYLVCGGDIVLSEDEWEAIKDRLVARGPE